MKKMIYCYNCDKDVTINVKKENNEYTIHNEKICIDEYNYYCPNCNEQLINDQLSNSLKSIYDVYLNMYNLSINDFKLIRNELNLSQELFAKALGWSKKTIVRYENGQSLPQKQYLFVYEKLKESKDEFMNILNHNKEKLGNDYYIILNKTKTYLNAKTINTFLYLLDNNPLYETQIMKYLFAIDFYNAKENKQPITQLKYAHAPFGPIIDDKDNILNTLLQNKYLSIITTDDDKVKFISSIKCDEKNFNEKELENLNTIKLKFKNKSSVALSNWSHEFEGWKKTQNGEIINFEYAKDFNLI